MSNPNENIKIIETGDGSHTLYNKELDEHYHSTHGSIQEAEHVFIEMGLNQFKGKKLGINILEVGFGTGLNCMLSALNHGKLKIEYVGLEPFPVQEKYIKALNYVEQIGGTSKKLNYEIHSCKWEEWTDLNKDFKLFKSKNSIQEYENALRADLIYFDAFAPRPQPEMWDVEVFQKCFSLMGQGGILVTYCAKGQVRRNMQEVGFIVERLPGPPGKREMLRARKP